jgi:glycosyltransferase involved in cell wall biosynthesis
MKILVALTYYHPYWTGLTKHAVLLSEELVNNKFDVSVLCTRHKKNLKSSEIVNGVKVFRSSIVFGLSRTQISLKIFIDLICHIKRANVIVVYLPYAEALYACMVARILNKKIFLVHNGDLLLPRGVFNVLVDSLYTQITRCAIRMSNKIIIHTKDYAKSSRVLSGFENKWVEILPLNDYLQVRRIDVTKFKRKHKFENKILIGFSGRFVEEKGVEYLLKAIPLVVNILPNVHFVFAGDYKVPYEDYWEKVSKLVEENSKAITLLGLIENQKELASFYSSLKVLVLPSRKDCFPYSQIEAMMYGIPVVCTNIPGARWMVKKTGMGVLVLKENPKQIAKGILEVLRNHSKYSKHKKEVYKIINNRKTVQKYIQLIS